MKINVPSIASDEEICAALRQPKTKDRGFRLLLHAYKERLYWHVRKIVGVHEDADDVVQNMWVKVYTNVDRFKGESSLYTWMYRIATNEALSLIRKRKKYASSDEEYLTDWTDRLTADPYFNGEEASLILEKIVMTLPPKQKQVFLLKYYEEMTYDQISEVMRVSVGSLKAQFHHAKNKIHLALQREF